MEPLEQFISGKDTHVIIKELRGDATRVILAVNVNAPYDPFVVWRENVSDGARYSGGYYSTLDEALNDFNQRLKV